MYLLVMGGIRDNKVYNNIRENLKGRSLYNPENPYAIDNKNLVRSINSIIGMIPGKSIDITNTVIGRMFLENQTPIMTIGLQQYSKHLAQSVRSYGMSDVLPSANLINLFDGNPNTKFLTKKEDYRITRDETKTGFGKILQDITNQSPKLNYKLSNQYDKIRNTGKGQLNTFFESISKNLYLQTSERFISVAEDQGYKIDKITTSLDNKVYYPTDNYAMFPDGELASKKVRDENILFRQERNEENISEYGSEISSLGHGYSKKYEKQDIAQNKPGDPLEEDIDIGDESFGFTNENINDQIVWGKTDNLRDFGVRTGALLYTKGLLQARGRMGFFDQTKKKIKYKDKISYNGSPLTRNINGDQKSERQSTIEDPYNNYKKAIRFDGNNIYDAPVESVINKTVIPKLHPIYKSSTEIDRNNMMFSIENLAYVLNDAGYLGDGTLNTKVPKSEVGVNRGRLMWFAPYDIEVGEVANAKYETVNFIGRSEPIYSYQSSERTATLSFKLIIDYPPHVDGLSHGDNAKFFAFGGTKYNNLRNIDIEKEKAKLNQSKSLLDKLKPTEELFTPENLETGTKAKFYFNNDERDLNIDFGMGYENGIKDDHEKFDFRLNVPFVNDIKKAVNILISDLGNGKAFRFFKLNFIGRASKLYKDQRNEATYNKNLGEDRAKSLKDYFEKEFIDAYGTDLTTAGISFKVDTEGSKEGSLIGSTVKGIDLIEVKKERCAWVEFVRNDFVDKKVVELTTSELEKKAVLEKEIREQESLIALASKVQNEERLFNEIKMEDRAMRGFESMKRITFSPVFHSQTPEDFHRRLTFLHQCTRQGNSVVNKSTTDAGIEASTNSVFGRPPICILRLGDMFHSKVIIESVDFDYADSVWDINPEGMGMQFMIANIRLSMKIIGGQSLKSAIDVIQNAESFNYYANSTYFNNDVYQFARKVEDAQVLGNTTLTNNKGQTRFGSNIDGKNGGSFK